MICDKIGFQTYKIAMVSASKQRRKNRHKYQAYLCRDCGMYHVSTVTKTLKPKKQDKINRKYPFRFDDFINARKNRK